MKDVELAKTKEYIIGDMYFGLESSDSLAELCTIQYILTPDQYVEKIKK